MRYGLRGYLIPFAPHTFAPQRQKDPGQPPSPAGLTQFFYGFYSSEMNQGHPGPFSSHHFRDLYRCSALNDLPPSRGYLVGPTKCTAVPELPSLGPLRPLGGRTTPITGTAAYAPFTPSHDGQHLPPPYYRDCWHEISRGILFRENHHLSRRKDGWEPLWAPIGWFTTRRPSSYLTHGAGWIKLSPIVQNSLLLPKGPGLFSIPVWRYVLANPLGIFG